MKLSRALGLSFVGEEDLSLFTRLEINFFGFFLAGFDALRGDFHLDRGPFLCAVHGQHSHLKIVSDSGESRSGGFENEGLGGHNLSICRATASVARDRSCHDAESCQVFGEFETDFRQPVFVGDHLGLPNRGRLEVFAESGVVATATTLVLTLGSVAPLPNHIGTALGGFDS